MRLFGALAVTMLQLVAACATSSSAWVAIANSDRFTDEAGCRVVPRAATDAEPYGTNFYVFVENHPTGVRAGVMSGGVIDGGVKLPTGQVQLRIDSNKAWVIETTETPIDENGAMYAGMIAQTKEMARAHPQLAASLEASAASSAKNMAQQTSPFTATTGDRAKAIVDQMKSGKTVIYRQIGLVTGKSSTGEAPLGADFVSALRTCGIR